MSGIWDDLKAAAWSTTYGLLNPQRKLYNIVAKSLYTKILDNPNADSTDIYLQETVPLHVFETVAAPGTTANNWVLWTGAATQRAERAISRRTTFTSLRFLCRGTALASAVTCVVERMPRSDSSGVIDTPLTFVIPSGTAVGTMVSIINTPVEFFPGDTVALRIAQAAAVAQAGWHAVWSLG
jgi:hypothetical protein